MANESDPSQSQPNASSDAKECSTPIKVIRIIDRLQPVPVELKERPPLQKSATPQELPKKQPNAVPPQSPPAQPKTPAEPLASPKPPPSEPKPKLGAKPPLQPESQPGKARQASTSRPVDLGPPPKARRPRKLEPPAEKPDAPALEIDWAGDDRDTGNAEVRKPRSLIDVDLGKKRRGKDKTERQTEKATTKVRFREETKPVTEFAAPEPPLDLERSKKPKKPEPKPIDELDFEDEEEAARKNLGLFSRLGLGIRDLILISIACIPAVAAAWVIDWKAVNVPFGSEWERVDLLSDLHKGQLELTEFLAPEYGQRQAVPRAVYLFLARLTGGDVKAEVWISFGALAAGAAGIFFLLGRSVGSGMKLGISFFLANLLLFSPVHAHSLLSPNAFGIHLANACLIWACFIVTRRFPGWLRLGFCLLFGILGSYSSIHGLMIWPVVGILQLLSSYSGRVWKRVSFLLVWALVGAFVIGDYFSEVGPDGSLSFSRLEAVQGIEPEQGVTEWFALIGDLVLRGWQEPENREFIMLPGLLVVSLFLLNAIGWLVCTLGHARTLLWNRCLPWIGIGAAGLLGAGLVCVFVERSAIPGPGLDFSLLLTPVLVSILAVFTILTTDKIQRSPESNLSDHLPIWWALVVMSIMLHQGGGWFKGHWMTNQVLAERLETRTQLLFMDHFPAEEWKGFGTEDPATIRQRAHFLNRHGYLSPPILPDLRMTYFGMPQDPLASELGKLDLPQLTGESFLFTGSARLPTFDHRAADLVALVRRFQDNGTREILAISSRVDRDLEKWQAALQTSSEDPVEFWAIDASKMKAYRFSQQFSPNGGVPVLEKIGGMVD